MLQLRTGIADTNHWALCSLESQGQEALVRTVHSTGETHNPPPLGILYCQQKENLMEAKGSKWWLAGLHGWRTEVLSSDFIQDGWRRFCIVFSVFFWRVIRDGHLQCWRT